MLTRLRGPGTPFSARRGLAHRGARVEALEPGRQLTAALAPRQRAVAQVEVSEQRAAGDVPHGDAIGRHGTGQSLEVAGKRSEEHTSELQSLMRNSYAVFCLQKKNIHKTLIRCI